MNGMDFRDIIYNPERYKADGKEIRSVRLEVTKEST